MALSTKTHVAIIMDGNGRWAVNQGRPRETGHRAGLQSLKRTVKAAPRHGIGTLTLYAFSSDNWRRPKPEIAALMGLLRRYLQWEAPRLKENGVRLEVIGRRDRLPADIRQAITAVEDLTRHGTRLRLRIALDYSARDAILTAATRLSDRDVSREEFARALNGNADDVDFLIRTGGEKRLSDFLLWELAYAELYFTKTFWPDFDEDDLAAALSAFAHRVRRFGGLAPNEAA